MRKSLFAALYFSLFVFFYFIISPKIAFASYVTCDSPANGTHVTIYTGAGTAKTFDLVASVYDDNPTPGIRENYVGKDGGLGAADPPSYYWDGTSPIQGSSNPMPKSFTYDGSTPDEHYWEAKVIFPDGEVKSCISYIYLDPPCGNWSFPSSCQGLTINPGSPPGTCTLCGQKDLLYTAGVITACDSGAQDCTTAGGAPGQYQQQYMNIGQCPVKVWDCQDTGITKYATNFTSYSCGDTGAMCNTSISSSCPYSWGNVDACPLNPPAPVPGTPTPTPTPGGATPTPTPTPTTGPSPTPNPSYPRINSLVVGNTAPTPTFQGIFGFSGNTINQSGSNWLNPMEITLSARPATGNYLYKYYVAFYRGSELTNKNTFLTDIKNRLGQSIAGNPKNGFLLYYNANNTVGIDNPLPYLGIFYIWDKTQFQAVSLTSSQTGGPRSSWQVKDASNNLLMTGYKIGGTPWATSGSGGYATWKIKLDENFSSKSMYTAVYVVDSSSIDPVAFISNITTQP